MLSPAAVNVTVAAVLRAASPTTDCLIVNVLAPLSVPLVITLEVIVVAPLTARLQILNLEVSNVVSVHGVPFGVE